MTEAINKEMLDRMRRIETRLTSYMVEQGFDAGSRPIWVDGEVTLPSRHCTVSSILKAIPDGWDEDVSVTIEGEFVMWVGTKEEN